MKSDSTPTRNRTYQNFVMDSTYWDEYEARDNDIIISTSYKSGTTWMQRICAALIFQSDSLTSPLDKLSPWLEARYQSKETVLSYLKSLTYRRFIKSHLPLNGIPYNPRVKYIVVGRNGLDVFMSFWNHWNNMRIEAIDNLNNIPDRHGEPFPYPPMDISIAFQDWLTTSSIKWETDGFPFWSHLDHIKSWWRFRHLDNVLFVHFNELLADLDAEMRKISAFLNIPVKESNWHELVKSASFNAMKSQANQLVPASTINLWKDSSKFFNKGINNQWKSVLPETLVEVYHQKARKKLGKKLSTWLEQGT